MKEASKLELKSYKIFLKRRLRSTADEGTNKAEDDENREERVAVELTIEEIEIEK